MEKMKLVNERELAEIFGIACSWLQILRIKGGGPPFYKIGGAVRYNLADVEKWLDQRKCQNTSEDRYKAAAAGSTTAPRPPEKPKKQRVALVAAGSA